MITMLIKLIIFLGILVGYWFLTIFLGVVMSTVRNEDDWAKYCYLVGLALFGFTQFVYIFL